jgi:hypothetical protein
MPTIRNWLYFALVNFLIMGYIVCLYYLTSLQEIKANWSLYRCNPMYMPLSDNIEQDFTYCIQNMQGNFMGYLLEPLTFITGSLSNMMGGFMNDINNVRYMFSNIRGYISNIFQSIFGVFLNLVIAFQKIIIGIKDIFSKTIGVLVSFLYILDGSIKTMGSAWNGPSGMLVRSLGKCFHPDTSIKLKNGNIVKIKDINLGDVLENGSVVQATMKIGNTDIKTYEDLYVIKDKGVNNGVNNEDILVTGSHLIYDDGLFISVKDCKNAVKSDIKTDVLSCLITSDHKIKIGQKIFWDWEDHFIKNFPKRIDM